MKSAALRAIAGAVPKTFVDAAHFAPIYGADEIARIDRFAGLDRRPRLQADARPLDLAILAARTAIAQANIAPGSIDTVLYVTQTPEFILPATACILQDRLGLGCGTAAFDMNLGCSGYVYGLFVAAALVGSGLRERVLVLAGDAGSRFLDEHDRATAPLFADAYSATIVDTDDRAGEIWPFELGTDGTGWAHLIVPVGGSAFPDRDAFARARPPELASVQGEPRVTYMNGEEIFAFTISRVPGLIAAVLKKAGLSIEQIDYFAMHQASAFILDHIQRKAVIPPEKVLRSLKQYGNTSSASIPLTLCHALHGTSGSPCLVAIVGFGVGYSWGATVVRIARDAIGPVVKFES